MEKYNIVYIDDQIDTGLSRYFDEKSFEAQIKDSEFIYEEVKYNPSEGYLNLIRKDVVQTANIIFIDSKLFSDTDHVESKISGEEFKVILRKFYPYIEVIVITQNGADDELGTISKYNSSVNSESNSQEYYDANLPDYIQKAVDNIKQFRKLAKKLDDSTSWEKALKEKVQNAINGLSEYDNLTASDISKLIELFKEIQEKIDG